MVGAFSETEHRYHTHGGPRPRRSARVPNQSRPYRWREEESNPVAKHSDIEASLPQSFPHPAAATRRDVLRSTLIPLQLAGDVDD